MYAIQHNSIKTEQSPKTFSPILTRDILAAGGATALALKDKPVARPLTDAEREASLAAFMEDRPNGDLWVFGYGSLIWNLALKSAERRIACISGWHRSFCLSMTAGRGTPENPGLVLGLDRGGSCCGVADRIAESNIASELSILWSREMLLGGYNPMWIELCGTDGQKFGSAIAFAIDHEHENYAGKLSQHEKVRRLATAAGSWGSSVDYLRRTIIGLRAHGIPDTEMERLGDLVESATFDERWGKAA